MVLGYPTQNPFSIYGQSEFEKEEQRKRELMDTMYGGNFGGSKKKEKESVGVKIEEILDGEEKRVRQAERERVGKTGLEAV